ncbi:TonB-dependent receptor [Pedobacter kyonggii]|uniref:TonB-dependent receptor n=1 Tax=Pedobacter kyonggii TaxID=1926871 RepID=A0A4Q9H9S3_9SPHI|nr:TonB-dependent receptor [Pedobacter kyonggii]TBO40745.1 hypothetical protein EYS08_17470 [Pedobacter kyonggii]
MKIGFYEYIKEYIISFDYRPTAIMLLLCVLLFNQALARSFEQTPGESSVSIKIAEMSITDALSLLEEKAGLSINYNRSIFSQNSKISLEVKNMPLELILKKILSGTRVAYRFADTNTILLYKLPDPVKPGRISGKILDEKGETLPGASIKVIQTGKATQTASDGSYTLSVEPGIYTIEVSYISFVTQRISEVNVKADKNTPLDISLKPDAKGLQEVVVTASYKKASVEGLLARQKNASEISNGISAEQIGRTPDKNIGESLKRISGVSSIDNKFVIVRGIGERYNSAQLDGVTLPSTEAQTRNFSFDLIPSNLVDNVVVSKTVTPDMNTSFGGGLIQINTKDIPTENFMSFTAGTSYNDQSTGKDFLSHKRGKYDYLGFDDGRRDYPKDLVVTDRRVAPNNSLTEAEYAKKVEMQSRLFTNDNFTIYRYQAVPSQNYQFSIGRMIQVDTLKQKRLGFTGSISYRNTQQINTFDQQKRGDWSASELYNNAGSSYGFNTTWSALLNIGYQSGKNRYSFRNNYTHMYDNALVRTLGHSFDVSGNTPANRLEETDDPTFTDLLQNKLSGQHQAGKFKIEWSLARTSINRTEKDVILATQVPRLIGKEYQYFYDIVNSSEPRILPTSRHHYENAEEHYSWDVSTSVPFEVSGTRNTLKTGYFGNWKQARFNWTIASFSANFNTLPDSLRYLTIAEMQQPENIRGANGFFYNVGNGFQDIYKGKSLTQAGFAMFDTRFLEKFRLVWGVRAEYYKYDEINNGNNTNLKIFSIKPDKHWQWLPSANLTYSPTSSFNIRTAFSSSVIRPELLDNSQFWRYSPYLGAQFGNQGLYSTRINSYDLKAEWFPGLGEIISAGGFYKKFDTPTELTFSTASGNINYYLKSADFAQVYGLELELRKNFNFISTHKLFSNLTAYANLTLQRSDVKGTYLVANTDPNGPPSIEASSKQNRPMYGQSPYLVNLGLQYNASRFGFNIMYNKSGYKTYIVSELPADIEYEKPRAQIDAQISGRLLKNRLEIKINAGNILNRASVFYRNTASYEVNPDYVGGDADRSNRTRLKEGYSNKYDDGDLISFSQKFGRTYSTSITYNF